MSASSPLDLHGCGLFWHHLRHPPFTNHTDGSGKSKGEAECNWRFFVQVSYMGPCFESFLYKARSRVTQNFDGNLQLVLSLSSYVRMQQLVWRKYRWVKETCKKKNMGISCASRRGPYHDQHIANQYFILFGSFQLGWVVDIRNEKTHPPLRTGTIPMKSPLYFFL